MKDLVTYIAVFLIAVALTIGVLAVLIGAGVWIASTDTPGGVALGILVAGGAPTAVWMGWAWLHEHA